MKLFTSVSAIVLSLGTSLIAQDQPERVNAFDDWGVYQANNPKECWITSAASKVENTRSGKAVTVNRGNIFLNVTWLPDSNIVGEVSFSGGYPFDPNFGIKVQIGNETWDLVPDGEHAWPENAEADSKLRVAMTKGANAVITAQSTRGTNTRDTFSLKGFTAALNDAKSRCGVG